MNADRAPLSDASTVGELSPSLLVDAVGSDPQVERCRRLLGLGACQRLGIYALPADFCLTVIVPVYNESSSIASVIERVRQTQLPLQIIVVDDGSDDGTAEVLAALAGQPGLVLMRHAVNRGKGAAIRTALPHIAGQIAVIQDADREYDPHEFRYLMQPILQGHADVVYGTRYGHVDRQVSPLWHEMVNGLLTMLTNVCLGVRLNDVETCYKMATREAWQQVAEKLRENRFGIEIELTARWVRGRMRLAQRPIRYQHRWYAEGKKIGWRDGVAALGCIVRYGLLRR